MKNDKEILENLNKKQQEAVSFGDGPLLIVAGAGTGKTTVITQRIAWLILTGKCRAEEILALTFTDKAAGEMEQRVDMALPYGYVDLSISTFHAFCEKILKDHALDIGLPNDFKLIDEINAWMLIRKNLSRFKLDYYKPLGNPTKFIHALIKHFSRAQDEEIMPADYLEYANKLLLDNDIAADSKLLVSNKSDDETAILQQEALRINEIANAYHVYQQILLENEALDFGNLITYTLKLFRERPKILKQYQDKFKYILVDEFQDTNWAQYELIKLLAGKQSNLTVVGDDDQAIYKFRGASLANILQFKSDYPQSREVVLTSNYRSCQEILDIAYKFIQLNNPNRLEWQLAQNKNKDSSDALNKKLVASIAEKGLIEHLHCATLEDEVVKVAEKIIKLKEGNEELNWGDFAILVRSNDAANAFINYFDQKDLPYEFLALKGLYSKPIILDCLAYFKLLDNYHEGPALYKILSLPFLGISSKSIVELNFYAYRKGCSLWQSIQSIDLQKDISLDDVEKIKKITSLIEQHSSLAKQKNPGEILLHFLSDTKYLDYLKLKNDKDSQKSFQYLNQFYKLIKEYLTQEPKAKLRDFMELISLELAAGSQGRMQPDADLGPESIKIMTVHGSKGLEFKYVFVVNLVDKRFPTIARSDAIELPEKLIKEKLNSGDIHLEEERRLFYVAMTRAKSGLFFTSAADYGGSREKKLSRFLYELGYDNQSMFDSLAATDDLGLTSKKVKKVEKVEYRLPRVYSFSQLASFQKCPLQYKYAFILRIPIFGKANFSFGKTMHATLQKFLSLIIEKQQKIQGSLFKQSNKDYNEDNKKNLCKLEELIEIYKDCWDDNWYKDANERDQYFERGLKSLESFYDDFNKNLPQPQYLERDFTLKVGQYPDIYSLRGRIDRIDILPDGRVEIIDYKTGNPKDESKLDKESKEQLIIYQVACEELFGQTPAKLTYYYLETGKQISFLADDEEKEDLKFSIREIIDKIKNSDFEPSPGWQCKFCDYNSICEFRQN